jgi:mRNA interferase MazF
MVVLSRDSSIGRLRRVVVAPCSSGVRGLPTEVVLEPGKDPVGRRCAVHLDSLHNLSVGHFVERMGRLTGVRMRQICVALEVALDCPR